MSNERKPLLTEEQIQEMLEYSKGHVVEANNWLNRGEPFVWDMMNKANADPVIVGMDLFLAFLRGKTKRVLNIDCLCADVKAWVDDPNRKSPEWMMLYYDATDLAIREDFDFQPDDAVCTFAATIGINPDDYFEEVEVTE